MRSLLHTSRERGQAMITAVVFFMVGSIILLTGAVVPALTDVRIAEDLNFSRASYYLSEGAIEDVGYRVQHNMLFSNPETLVAGHTAVSVATTDVGGAKEVVGVGDAFDRERTVKLLFTLGEGTAFNYGVQAGDGGFSINNSASVRGNVFSSGPILVTNSGTVYGDAISAGPSGLVDGLTATGSVSAHTIRDSMIHRDAYYVSLTNSTVLGTLYPNSPDQATSSLPIDDAQVEEWKTSALAGGTHTSPCPYTISGTVTIGPIKINCDLTISGTSVVSLAGPVWVDGDITISGNSIIKTHASIGTASVAMIADETSAPLTGGLITLSNSPVFVGSGTSNILLLSQNKAAENNQSTKAISISNSASGALLLYAAHGEIELSNSIQLREVTAYKISMQNSAQVIYQSGLANTFFTSGPGGGFVVQGWEEP